MERTVMKSGDSSSKVKLEKDYPYGYGYPWPPKYYTCSFCQREFKSAQALGGHMNIHRRDRAARLRDQSPDNNPILVNMTSDTNPNLDNHYPNIYAHHYSLVSLSLSSLPPTRNGERSVPIMGIGSDEHGSLQHHLETGARVLINNDSSTKEEVVKLDLELCVGDDQVKEDLDLELRLGI